MKYEIIEQKDYGDYIIVKLKTKVNHELVIYKHQLQEKTIYEVIEEYLNEYESIYPETKVN